MRVAVLFILIFISILLLSCNFQNQLIVATVVVFLKFTQVYLKDLQCITKLLHQFRYLVNSFVAGLNNPIHGINFSQPCVTNIKNNVKSKILVQTFCMPLTIQASVSRNLYLLISKTKLFFCFILQKYKHLYYAFIGSGIRELFLCVAQRC